MPFHWDLSRSRPASQGLGRSQTRTTSQKTSLFLPALFCLGIFYVNSVFAQSSLLDLTAEDPAKIKTAEACGECHISEYEVWKTTPHATGFKTLHRRDEAAAIAERMGVSLIKRDSPCLRCHFTAVEKKEQLRAVSGVSCESCHGAGADWIDVHNDYGGKGFDHTNETAEHREERLRRSRELGMRRPTELYPVVASCYTCHSVPFEDLVNQGGHPAGSGDFELVARYGDIEHNFLQSFLDGDGTELEQRTQEQKRLMYFTGRALEVESALRGVAEATEKGTYASSMIRRVRLATNELRAIGRRSEATQIDDILGILRQAQITVGNRDALVRAADAVGEATRAFLADQDGTQLAALDPLLRGETDDLPDDEDEGDAVQVADAATPSSDGATPGAAPTAPDSSGSTATSGNTRPAAATQSAAIPAVGEIKRRIRPASQHDTVGPSTCTGCHRHSPQSEWWFDDAHYRSADRFFEEDPKAVKIARLYGIRPDRMSRGDQVCMDCHGTVVSGKEKREAGDGVGCESCHGAAKDYLDPHQEGEPEDGVQRVGYQKALQLGMAELQDASVRATTCTECHYITEPRLISAGHPSGQDFDYLEGMGTIQHWETDSVSAGELRSAFASRLQQRGAVPSVRLARLAGDGLTPASGDASGGAAARTASAAEGGSAASSAGATRNARPSTARRSARNPRPGPDASDAPLSSLDLPPFPDIDEDTPIEEVLRLLEERLRQLYEATSPSSTSTGASAPGERP